VVGDCSEVVVRLEGDVFEMEDQRNWTDASFKIYSRPLAWARPYRLEAGAEIQQSITMEVRGTWKPNEIAPVASQSGRISLPLPGIGFTLPGPIPSSLRERVRALRPAHVRVEATPDTLAATLDWARADATFLDCALVVAIRSTRDSAPDRSLFPSRCTVHLFDAEGNSASRETLAAWQRAGHNSLATGTLHNFAELNRNRPPADGSHTHTVFGINAQIHAEDDVSILETLTQHEAVARCAHRVGAGRPVIVGPISLGRRNDSVDPRVRTQFGARWLLESLKLLAKSACVESVTCFHAHGPAGFMDETRSTPVERLLKALAGRDTLPADFAIPA
jgi:D-apionolactonase